MFECIGCPSLEFESKPDLEAHVAAIHFNYLPYECEKCRFAKFPTEYAIRYHWEFEHQISEYCIRYRVSPELINKREEINTYVQQCVDRQITVPSQNADYDAEALEEKPNLESTITETNGNFPSSSISPVLKQLFGNVADLNANLSLGDSSNNNTENNIPITKTKKSSNRKSKNVASDALKQMKRKRVATSIEPTASSSSTASSSTSSSSTASSTEGTSSSPVLNSATVECTECKRVIANQATSVMYHTNSRHLQLPVFTCTPCKRIWTTISRSDLLKHVKNFHNNDMSVIVDKKEEHIIKIKEKCRQLFPNRGTMVSKRKCYDNSVINEESTEAE